MSEQALPAAPASVESTAPAGGSGAGAPSVPPGYVPASELERVESQRRSLQSELDRIRATPAPVPPASGGSGSSTKAPSGFDPEAFRREVLSSVYGANAMTQAADKLKSEYEYADPGLFDSELLPEYGSVEAFRAAVEADHNRVKAIVEAKLAATQPQAQPIPSPLGPGNPAGSAPAGDPTVQQLAALSPAELEAFDSANPGVIARVMRAVG